MNKLIVFLLLVAFCGQASAAPPPLPSGLGQKKQQAEKPQKPKQPALPTGLGKLGTPPGPVLPPGLGTKTADKKQSASDDQGWQDRLGITLSGFAEARIGVRTQSDLNEKAASIGETRLQLSAEKEWSLATATLTADFLYDPVLDQHAINFESGNGWLDLREAHLLFRPTGFSDLKVGRQVLTWGTGDLLFINDLFPKDFNSFFIGRDEEYLKAPSDAARLSLFSKAANLDIAYTPRFDSDRYIDGSRISFFSPLAGERVGRRAAPFSADQPDRWFKDDELALRLHRTIGGLEAALYFYDGFWKSPGGLSAETGEALFPRLRVYGGSARKPLWGGIANAEVGFYQSLDDKNGSDAFINNSEFRLLVGFEKDIGHELTGSFQYYIERISGYDAYLASLPQGSRPRDHTRHLLTGRLTKFLMNQNLMLSLFAYYSPSDKDGYLRPKISYKLSDNWAANIGANLFFGADQASFFGQFTKNNNIFAGIRRSF